MKKVLFALLISLSTLSLRAGGESGMASLSGKIVDKDGMPLAGAKVVLQSSKSAVYTDFDGNFTFSEVLATTQELNVSYVSYKDCQSIVDLSKRKSSEVLITLKSK